ncbi:phospholipase D family protein [Chryseolinea sp. T2]|uniref:phospholipase D family protein n=1 Tax=Chryseolinea sp. T2 TaxID=3129255 RepID=UPI0030775AEB
MLHPQNNRIDYGEQLVPPPGYELNRAIGTTYCLELEALMVLPVALFYAQTLESKPIEIRYDMLEAITKAAEKITVYYHNSQLKVPVKYHYLLAYWEKGIEAITMPNHVSSFHPKVWVVRYESKDRRPLYRILVTSRNLTFARDWDVAFSAEGIVTEKDQPKNKPLIHFLTYLSEHGQRAIEPKFIQELSTVKFDFPEKFDGFRFLPVGVPNSETGKSYVNPLTSKKNAWDELLVISPFLDTNTIQKLKEASGKTPYLFSTKQELDCLPEALLSDLDVWQFSKFVEEAEHMPELAEEGEVSMSQNLHAKLFIGKVNDEVTWFLGSANCTDPAQGRNVEFMVELFTNKLSGVKPRDIVNSLTDSSKANGFALFTPYELSARIDGEVQKRIDLEIRKIKYDLSRLKISGKANKIESGQAYNLVIEIDARKITWADTYTIKIKPLPEQQKAGVLVMAGIVNTIDSFTNYVETLLSPFVQFEIFYKDLSQSCFLLKMEIELPESRLHRIFTSIIDSREKFLKYLAFLLTGEETGLIVSNADPRGEMGVNEHESWGFEGMPVFEKLLMAASRQPEKLRSIDNLITRLKSETTPDDKPIVTPEFESLWAVFQTFIEKEK